MGVAQRALLRQRRLGTLLETTAIRDAPEETGNKLRVIRQADPEKDLILVVRIKVELSIKGSTVFLQYGRSIIVFRNTCCVWRWARRVMPLPWAALASLPAAQVRRPTTTDQRRAAQRRLAGPLTSGCRPGRGT